MCIAVFVLNGFVSIASKLHQVETGFYKVSTTDLVLLGGILKFVLTGILYLLVRKRIEMKYEKKTEAMALTIIVASAAAGGFHIQCSFFGGQLHSRHRYYIRLLPEAVSMHRH